MTDNKLIAKFMKHDDVDCDNCKLRFDCNHFQCGLSENEKEELLKYHNSWDWLMKVVEKIEDTSFSGIKSEYVPYTNKPFLVKMHYNSAKITIDNDFKIENSIKDGICFTEFNEDTKIDSCYKAVVEFIMWYNAVVS